MDIFLSTFLKIFFIMSPFFVITVFLTVTKESSLAIRQKLAIKVTFSVLIMSLVLLFFGGNIFAIFGITLDAFRIGAGALLFLTAIQLVNGSNEDTKTDTNNALDSAVVPLALPVTVGPGTIGILLVMGADYKNTTELIIGSSALVLAVIAIGFMLYSSSFFEKIISQQGLTVLSKVTGIFVAAISAQIMFTGIKNFLSL
jgi:multiple antibiotic resistance protein|tara:strand:+ start:194 stop:793 length:600 start_codon:yes stop_codon:yes gene_type:complete